MRRLTTDDRNDMFAPFNLFFARNNEVWIRGGGAPPDYADTTLVEWIRQAAQKHDLCIEAEDTESLGDEMLDALFDGSDTVEGIVALLHTAAIQAAEMRWRLEQLENIIGDNYDFDHLQKCLACETMKEAPTMAKLSVEIPKDEPSSVSVRVQGDSENELIICLGYLVHAVAGDMGIPVQTLLSMVSADEGRLRSTILEHQKVDLSAIREIQERRAANGESEDR